MTTRGKTEWRCAVDGCDHNAHERRICHTCAGQLTRDIAELPALLDDLAITLSRQARIGSRNGKARAAERPLPYDLRASEAGDVLRSTLVGWVRELYDGVELWPTDSLHAMALWLHVREPRLLNHPAAEEAVDEIGAATQLARCVTDRPLAKVYAGPCDADGCDGELYAKPFDADVACPECGITHAVDERREAMLAELDEMLFPLTQIAKLANYFGGVDSRRASKLLGIWEARRRITPHSVDREGRGLYPFGETLALLLAAPRRVRRAA